MESSQGQQAWRDRMNKTHRFGIPCLPPTTRITKRKGAIMARTITLPARANAITYGDAEVIDVLLTLWESPASEAVVIDDATDTEPKARVRTRSMAKLLDVDGFTITAEEFPEDFSGNIEEYEAEPEEGAAKDAATTYFIPGMKVRTHVVTEGDKFLPVLSRKN